MSVTKSLLPSLLIVALGFLAPAPLEVTQSADQGWGITARVQRPYYGAGETARVAFTLFNSSARDAYGFVPVKGGNGCEYRVTVEDVAGNVVWQPGSIANGTYWGPGCLYGSTTWGVTGGTSLTRQTAIQLIYQNPSGFGTLGDPLAPGFYKVCIDVWFGGPQHTPAPGPGLSHRACVPVQIEP